MREIMEFKVTPWIAENSPTQEYLTEQLEEEDLRVYQWSSPPQEDFDGHTHGYHKVLYVVEGSIKFEFPTRHETINLTPGDRLDLPGGIRHNAVVGMDGVKCLEAHIY
jgi:quercetin dioxygenase-like cupin family protein